MGVVLGPMTNTLDSQDRRRPQNGRVLVDPKFVIVPIPQKRLPMGPTWTPIDPVVGPSRPYRPQSALLRSLDRCRLIGLSNHLQLDFTISLTGLIWITPVISRVISPAKSG